MTESLDNGIQLAVLGICAGITIYKALMSKTREWAMLAIFFFGFFMGNLYWQLFLQFYGETPTVFYVSELNWYVADFFLFLLLRTVMAQQTLQMDMAASKKLRIAGWIIAVFVSAMCIFYMQWGEYISNIIAAIMMGLIAFQSVKGIRFLPGFSKRRLCIWSFAFVVIEYALWTGSCFLEGDSWTNPYFWFDGALTVVFLLIFTAGMKELGEDK